MGQRLGVPCCVGRSLRCLQPQRQRLVDQTRFGAMSRQQLRLTRHVLRRERAQHRGNASMRLLAPALQETCIRRVLHQCMLEGVVRTRRCATTEHQFAGYELIESRTQPRLGPQCYGGQQLIAELASDAGSDLCNLLDWREPIEPRHQRVLQRGGHRQRWERPVQRPLAALRPKQPGLEHRLGQFFDEQRHPVGMSHDLLEQRLGQCPAAGQPRNDHCTFVVG